MQSAGGAVAVVQVSPFQITLRNRLAPYPTVTLRPLQSRCRCQCPGNPQSIQNSRDWQSDTFKLWALIRVSNSFMFMSLPYFTCFLSVLSHCSLSFLRRCAITDLKSGPLGALSWMQINPLFNPTPVDLKASHCLNRRSYLVRSGLELLLKCEPGPFKFPEQRSYGQWLDHRGQIKSSILIDLEREYLDTVLQMILCICDTNLTPTSPRHNREQ